MSEGGSRKDAGNPERDVVSDVVGNEPRRLPRWGLPVLVVLAAAGAVVLWLPPSTGDRPKAGPPGAAATAASPQAPAPATVDAPVDACREVILAVNDLTDGLLGTWPPLTPAALQRVERHQQTVARSRTLLRPAEQAVADSASQAMSALRRGEASGDPLGVLRAKGSALASACVS
jgi:hypothetical protein